MATLGVTKTKISAGPSHVTGPAKLIEMGQYTDNMNDPIACRMEVILGTFWRQLCLDESRTVKESVLTDFFNRT
jgi:hypothetical protein